MARSSAFENIKKLILVLTSHQKSEFRKSIKGWGEKKQYEDVYELVNRELVKNPDFSFDDYLKLPTQKGKLGQTEFNYTANYLFEKLLDSARKTSSTGKLRRDLYVILENIYFFYNVELYEDCRAELEKAKKIAGELDSPVFQIEVNYWERKLLLGVSHELTTEKVDNLLASDQSTIEALSKNSDLMEIISRMNLERQFKELTPYTIGKLAEFEKAYLADRYFEFYNALHARSIISNVLTEKQFQPNGSQAFAGFELGYAGNIQNMGEKIAILFENPKYREEDPARFWAALSNYFTACFREKRLDLIEKIEPMVPHEPETVAFLRYWVYFNLTKLIKQNRFAEAVVFIQKNDLNKRLVFQKNRMSHARFFSNLYLSAIVLFVQNELDAADDFLVQIRRHRTEKSPKDVLAMAALLQLIIKFEQKSFGSGGEFLDSEMRKTQRFLKEINEVDAFNRHFLLDFEKMVVEQNPKVFVAAAQKMFEKMPPYLDIKKDAEPYKMVIAWLEARMLEKPVNAVIHGYI